MSIIKKRVNLVVKDKKISKEAEPRKRSTAHYTEDVTKSVEDSRRLPPLRDIGKLESASIKDMVDGFVTYAFSSGASDVHIDPTEENMTIRLRIDGILHDVLVLPRRLQSMVVTRIKVMAGLRTDEHQAAQDGRFRILHGDVPIDLRVSIIPTFYGENVVMRLLVGQVRALELEELGMTPRDLEVIKDNMKKSYGMILATGPTGSGKTTSLYSVLQILNQRERSIITIEDPIEYAIPGLTQIQVNPNTNLTFALGLRAIVRQDPNIIMVGEIRDRETAGIAINAAMTGHLLLSTLHTNDAAVTLPRLIDMGIEPFLIASTVNIAIGQRLIRRLCPKCAKKRIISKLEAESLRSVIPPTVLAKFKEVSEPVGCSACNQTGFTGRIGIYEVLEMTEQIRHMVMRRENADAIREAAIKDGMVPMLEDGLKKAAAGITSIGEILRVIHE